jgi:histidine triad (HIT) family protein
MTMNDCIFCKIVRKEIPAEIVREDDTTIAFLDLNPVNPGHVLVVPKEHFEDFASTSDEALADIAVVARAVAAATIEAVGAPAFNIAVNNGPEAGQVVMHTHLHVMPRHKGDGYALWHGRPYGEGEMAAVGGKIREALKARS